ncbi:hypothetical protein VOLCADRAFT_81528 [Volvox carteri f. nagariensis]|uniref:Peptidase M20 dimerisation domain-containing protein n=1 Tax=Volvox carteri f. nagariensis TaxID=3068 RepID=D8TYP4_VOLCA|nr:uncharacterized protein VOLCADRAFT_81528 [Volvox carteri f. nagariensis]EFJ47428.1 hypothetical protein VOLCADRAFT_81528 [Volvox carteri f. nagariensis]|eukprot:XP_002951617.1 hypothetical protein VOLCADRAFT_81528 [Volvox carteri f. nagariensis]
MSALLLAVTAALAAVLQAQSLSPEEIFKRSEALQSWVIEQRREFHKTPEPGFTEYKTRSRIMRFLESQHIMYRYPFAKTGLVAYIGSGKPVVALRTDLDGLPILEPDGVPYKSQNDGWMHACGHDGHMAMLLGAAKLLKEASDQGELPPGSIRIVFQPAEEGGAGGDLMIREGALEDIEAAFAMHVMPHLSSGSIHTRPGTIMAGALSFRVTVRGRGGHAAMPHLNIDPVVAAAGLISALQTVVSRETSPLGSGVLSITMLRAGDAYNVIPDEVVFGGTIRGLTHEHLMFMKRRLEEMAPAVVAGYGCNATVDWRLEEQPYYPPTVNDERMATFALQTAATLLGTDQSQIAEPLMTGEDFAFFCRQVPCALLFLGIRNESAGSVHALHSPKFTLDESVLHKGVAMHATLAVEYLKTFAVAPDASSAKASASAATTTGGGGAAGDDEDEYDDDRVSKDEL